MVVLNYVSDRNSIKTNEESCLSVPSDENRIGIDVINRTIGIARENVNRAINASIKMLFSSSQPRKPSDLLALFRFPSPAAQQIAKSAEIFERTIQLVHEHVKEMDRVNISNEKYNFFHLLISFLINFTFFIAVFLTKLFFIT